MISYEAQSGSRSLNEFVVDVDRKGQRIIILKMLLEGPKTCKDFAMVGIMQYNARIKELREAGNNIQYDRLTRHFMLVPEVRVEEVKKMEEQKTVGAEAQYVSVEPDVWKPLVEEDSIEGVLKSKKVDVGPNDSKAYYLENEDGVFMVWGSTVLDDRMEVISLGEEVRITFKGLKENNKGQDTKIFKVERKVVA